MTVRRTTTVRPHQHYRRPRKHTLEEFLFQFGFCNLDLDRLVHLLHVSTLVVGIVLDRGGEERVDEGRLSESRLARNLSMLDYVHVHPVYAFHTMIVKAAPRFATILCLSNVRPRWGTYALAGEIPLVGQLQHMLAKYVRLRE
jgi:hypothetical protein